ncbi:MAG: T9SS type A sorting domain-containing protein, partial [Bacteroidota bacterium]
ISIEENAQITIEPGAEITTSEVMLSSAGSSGIIIESNSSGTGSLIHHEYDLEATIKRYVTGNSDLTAKSYHTVSIPLTKDANPQSDLFMGSYLYEFNATDQDWNALGTSTTTSLNVDQGYLIYYPDNNTTYTFGGPMNNGEFSAASMPGGSGDYHLVPNPYPSAIDWDAGSDWTKTDLYDAIWIWSASDGNWAAYGNDAGTNGASQYIPVGQAFMVQASGASPALTMNNDVRVHSSQAFLKKTKEDSDLLRIKAMANNCSDESIIRFRENATDDFEGSHDVTKMYGMGGSPQLYSFSADNHKLSINSIAPTTESKSINLGFELDKAGEVTFEFSSVESFDPQIPVKLLDIKTNTITDLTSNSKYTFHHHPDNDPSRFKVLLNSPLSVEELDESNLLIYFNKGNLHFDFASKKTSKAQVHIFNINGQKVFSTSLAPEQSTIPLSGLRKGIYIIQVISNDFSVTKKVQYY